MRRFVHAVVLLCVFTTPAMAQEVQWYVSLKGGISGGQDVEIEGGGLSGTADAEVGPVVLGTVGYYAMDDFRIEGEVSWRRLEAETISGLAADANLTNIAGMVNGIYDVPVFPSLKPFLLVGMGTSFVTGKMKRVGWYTIDLEDTKTVFAYQVGAGVAYPLTPTIAVDVSYRFFGTPTVDFDGIEVSNTHHTGLIGLTYAF